MTRGKLLDRVRIALAGSTAVKMVLGEETNFAQAGACPVGRDAAAPSMHDAYTQRSFKPRGTAARLRCQDAPGQDFPGRSRHCMAAMGSPPWPRPLHAPCLAHAPADISRASGMIKKLVLYYGMSDLGITTWAHQPYSADFLIGMQRSRKVPGGGGLPLALLGRKSREGHARGR